MNNIILIGMPGVGKSTVGVVLAKNLGYHFMDSDLVIQQKTGKLLHEIISQEGLDGFLAVEEEINASIETNRTIIATGGSAIFGKQAMEHFKQIGTIVYLKLSCEEIESRLGDLKERGVAMKKGETLQDIYKLRTPLYEQYADYILDCENKAIREIVAEMRTIFLKKEEK